MSCLALGSSAEQLWSVTAMLTSQDGAGLGTAPPALWGCWGVGELARGA